MRAALYLRVSTADQNTNNQQVELLRVATAKGWTIVETYEDHGISGAKGRDKRPSYDRMLKDAVRSKFDVLLAWDVSRLGRSLTGLVNALDDFQHNGVDLYLHQQAVDTTTPSGRALFQMCGVFAEFERAMISERVKAGLKRAQSQGKRLGRPTSDANVTQIKQDRATGMSIRKIAEKHQLSIGTTHTRLKD